MSVFGLFVALFMPIAMANQFNFHVSLFCLLVLWLVASECHHFAVVTSHNLLSYSVFTFYVAYHFGSFCLWAWFIFVFFCIFCLLVCHVTDCTTVSLYVCFGGVQTDWLYLLSLYIHTHTHIRLHNNQMESEKQATDRMQAHTSKL